MRSWCLRLDIGGRLDRKGNPVSKTWRMGVSERCRIGVARGRQHDMPARKFEPLTFVLDRQNPLR